jgi:tetratricopeptide (TPR) repeat protein
VIPAALAAFAIALQVAAPPGAVEDPALLAAIERFYATQEAEDVPGYLALWSPNARPPTPAQLGFVFEGGNDDFSEISITRVTGTEKELRVRLSVRRARTLTPSAKPASPPVVIDTVMRVALVFEKIKGEWKLLREGLAADDLALSIVDAATDEERAALLAAEPDLIGAQLLLALARLGSVEASRQNYARALEIFERQVRIARDSGFRKEEGEGLQNIGNALYFRRQFPDALAAYEQRLAIERERGDDGAVAAALSGIATVRYSLAEYGEALQRYREALAIHERLDDVIGIAYATLTIGNITYLQGDFPTAIASYRRSLELSRSVFNADGESRAQEGLGLVYTAQGDYAAALDALNGILKDSRMHSSRGRLGAVSQSAGDVHFRLGNLDAARKMFEDSRGHFESLQDLANVGRVMQSAALVDLVAGRFAQAEEGYTRSSTICAKAEDRECVARATAGLGYAQAAQEKFWDAAGSYRRAVEQFTALDQAESSARAEIGLSQALVGAEDFAGAIEAAARARRTAVATAIDDVLWRALTAEARAVRKLGDRERALGVARAAAVVMERLQAEALDKPGSRLPADASAAFATFAVLQAESGDPQGAFATSEKIRSLEIRGAIAVNERDIARGMTADQVEQERTLSTALASLLARLNREKGLPRPDAARLAALEPAVEQARIARRTFLDGLFDRLPDLRVWRGLAAPRTAPDAAPLLEDGTLLLSFVIDDDDLLIFVLGMAPAETSEGASAAADQPPAHVAVDARVVPVRRRRLAERVATLQRPGAVDDLAEWRNAASELSALLLPAGVREKLDAASHVVVMPHDVLWRVPFEALPTGDGLVIDRASVRLGASLESLLRSSAAPRSTGLPAVIVGAPELAGSRVDRLAQTSPAWRLRAAEDAAIEVMAAAADYEQEQVKVLTGAAATEGRVRAGASRASIVHVASPFCINGASPLFSPILLSAPASTVEAASGAGSPERIAAPPAATPPASAENGALELREVMNLSLDAGIVVLSDGAAMSMRDGASASGLVQWGWLAAGVPSLVVSRWTALEGAPRVLAEFHRGLRDGNAVPEAMRRAQLAVRAAEGMSAPVHWAGWATLGR